MNSSQIKTPRNGYNVCAAPRRVVHKGGGDQFICEM